MSNEIQKAGKHLPSFNVKAEGNATAVGYTDSVNMNMNIIMTDGTRNSLACEYFNLIIGYDPFEKDYILVDRDRALTEYMSDEVKAEFGMLTPEVIERIKKLPAIIAQEWDRTDQQQAVFAFISDVKVQDNGIKIRYQKFSIIPFNFIRENLDELAVHLFEIYRTHWSIKRVDLLDVLRENGLSPWNL